MQFILFLNVNQVFWFNILQSKFWLEIACPSRQLQVVLDIVLEVVRVHEVIAGVVRRVDVDQLDLVGVALLQKLQHLQVVAFDQRMLCGVPVHAFLVINLSKANKYFGRGVKRIIFLKTKVSHMLRQSITQ